jgi:hypothetical protein
VISQGCEGCGDGVENPWSPETPATNYMYFVTSLCFKNWYMPNASIIFHPAILWFWVLIKGVYILYLTTMYVYCVYPAISKSPKQLPNCLKIAETRVVLIVFNGVICDVSAYTVTVIFFQVPDITKDSPFFLFLKLVQMNLIFSNNVRIFAFIYRCMND